MSPRCGKAQLSLKLHLLCLRAWAKAYDVMKVEIQPGWVDSHPRPGCLQGGCSGRAVITPSGTAEMTLMGETRVIP